MPSFSSEVRGFVSNHKYLCLGTGGIAIGIYAIGNLCGRVVVCLRKCNSRTTEKTNKQRNKLNQAPPDRRQSQGHGRVTRPKLKTDVEIPAKFNMATTNGNGWFDSADILTLLWDLESQFPEIYFHPVNPIIENFSKIQKVITEDLDFLNASSENNKKRYSAYPLHVRGDHWTLIFIDRNDQLIEFYDSFVNFGEHNEVINALENLKQALNVKGKSYSVIPKITKQVQSNGKDCGAWMIYFIEKRLEKGPDFTRELQALNLSKCSTLIENYINELTVRAYLFTLISNVAKTEKNMKEADEADYETYKNRWLAAKAELERVTE